MNGEHYHLGVIRSSGRTNRQAVAARWALTFLDRAIPLGVLNSCIFRRSPRRASNERVPTPRAWFVTALAAAGSVSTAPGSHRCRFRILTYSVLPLRAFSRASPTPPAPSSLVAQGHGRLGGRDDVLCVRLDGPVEARVAQAVADVPTRPPHAMRNGTSMRANQYATFFYRQRQDDPRLYHLTIDTTALPVELLRRLSSSELLLRGSGAEKHRGCRPRNSDEQ